MGVGAPAQPKQTDLARQFLMSELGGGEAKPVKLLTEKAAQIGVSYDSLKRAKNELEITTIKKENRWVWEL